MINTFLNTCVVAFLALLTGVFAYIAWESQAVAPCIAMIIQGSLTGIMTFLALREYLK